MRILSEKNLSVHIDPKSEKKNENKSETFSAPDERVQTEQQLMRLMNAFDVRLMVQFRVPQIICLELHL